MTRYLTLEEVIVLHDLVIEQSGGIVGLAKHLDERTDVRPESLP